MAKKRRKTSRRSSSRLSVNNLPKMVSNAGMAVAAGLGVNYLANVASAKLNVPQLAQYSKYIAAYSAYSSSPGLPGIAAGAAFLVNGQSTGGSSSGGVGAFV